MFCITYRFLNNYVPTTFFCHVVLCLFVSRRDVQRVVFFVI